MKIKTIEDVENWILASNIIENEYKPIVVKEFKRLKVDGYFFTNMEFFLAKNQYGFDSMLRDKFHLYDPFILQQIKTAMLTKDMQSSLDLLEIDKNNVYKVNDDDDDDDDEIIINETTKKKELIIKQENPAEPSKGRFSPYRKEIETRFGDRSIPLTQEMFSKLKTYVETLRFNDMTDEARLHEITFELCKILGRKMQFIYNRITATTKQHKYCYTCKCKLCKSHVQKDDLSVQKLNVSIVFPSIAGNSNPYATLLPPKSFDIYICCQGTSDQPVIKKRKVVEDE